MCAISCRAIWVAWNGWSGLVVDIVGIAGADPQPVRTLRPGAERAEQDRPPPLPVEPGPELAQLDRNRHLQVAEDDGIPTFRARAEHCVPRRRCPSRHRLPPRHGRSIPPSSTPLRLDGSAARLARQVYRSLSSQVTVRNEFWSRQTGTLRPGRTGRWRESVAAAEAGGVGDGWHGRGHDRDQVVQTGSLAADRGAQAAV